MSKIYLIISCHSEGRQARRLVLKPIERIQARGSKREKGGMYWLFAIMYLYLDDWRSIFRFRFFILFWALRLCVDDDDVNAKQMISNTSEYI